MATFNPDLPANNSPISSSELREQFQGLAQAIDGSAANVNSVDTLNDAFTNTPATAADLEILRAKLNQLITTLWR